MAGFIGRVDRCESRLGTHFCYHRPEMPRPSKAVAILCIALVVVASFVPSSASQLSAIFVPLWLVVPAVIVSLVRRTAQRSDDQPLALLSLLDSRGPPLVA